MERKRKLDIGDEHSNTKARYGDGEAEDGDNANYWTGKPFSGRYFDILKKRKELAYLWQMKQSKLHHKIHSSCGIQLVWHGLSRMLNSPAPPCPLCVPSSSLSTMQRVRHFIDTYMI